METVLSIGRDEMVRLLSDLVAIDSVNPYFPGGEQAEAQVAAYVTDYCRDLGVPVRHQEVLPGRDNVIAELTVPGATKTIVLDSHMDTVSVDLMGERGLKPEVVNGRLTGRGSCDTKSSLAGMLCAFKRLVERSQGLRCNVVLLASADEEYLMRGIQAFARSGGVRADAAIVGEPTNLRVVVAHKGFLRWRLHTIGRAAHSSNPELGDNAIYQMAEVIRYLRAEYEPLLTQHRHPLCGNPTWSVGTIAGGAAVNIVPERCTIQVDRRIIPNETCAAAMAEFDAVLARLRRDRPELHAERDAPFIQDNGLDTPRDAPIARVVQAACRDLGVKTDLIGVKYGTHASTLAAAGIPTVVFGPGDIAQAHTADEYIAIDELVMGANLYEAAVRRFG